MKKIIAYMIIIFLAAFIAGCGSEAHANSSDWFSWDDKNTKLHYYVTALMLLDMGQTLHIADNPQMYYEKHNFYLDEHPTRTEVRQYFTWSYILMTASFYVLPSKVSHLAQKGVIGLEVYMVGNNAYIGVGVNF